MTILTYSINIQRIKVSMSKETKKTVVFCSVIIAMVVAIIFLIMHIRSLNHDLSVSEQNLKAANDTIHSTKILNGELMQYKRAYLIQSEDFSKYMDVSNAKIYALEKELKSKIEEIAVLQGQLNVGPVVCTDTVYKVKDSIHIDFGYTDKWLTLNGSTELFQDNAKTIMNNIKMEVPLTLGYTESNDFFVTTPNEYITFTDINCGKKPEEKYSNWSFGIQFGIGAGIDYGYSITNNGAGRGFGAGLVLYCGIGWTYGKKITKKHE